MPLKKGSSRKTVSRNIKEVVDSWEETGKIGNSHPVSKKKAVKQAVAISLKKAGKSKYQAKRKASATARKTAKKKEPVSYLKLVHSVRPRPGFSLLKSSLV